MYLSTQVHKYTSTQVHKYTSTQVHKYTSTQVHKHTSTQALLVIIISFFSFLPFQGVARINDCSYVLCTSILPNQATKDTVSKAYNSNHVHIYNNVCSTGSDVKIKESNNILGFNWGSLPDWLLLFSTIFGLFFAWKTLRNTANDNKVKIFLEFRARFKSDPIILGMLKYLTNLSETKPDHYDCFHFLGFYEELDKIEDSKIISLNDIDYFFGFYLEMFFKNDLYKKYISEDAPGWIRVQNLKEKIKNNKFKHFKK